MPKIWVVNASPVITLAKAGHLALLTEQADELLLPDAVVLELLAGPPSDPARRVLEGGWGRRVSIANVPAAVLEWGLGPGEAEVIAVALEQGDRLAVLDDAQGRKCARSLGVPVVGTLGVVLRAKKLGRLTSAAQVLRDLQGAGLYLDQEMIRSVLKQVAGEEWQP